MAEGEFLEVFVDTPLQVAEGRDVKGLYKKALSGQIPQFTGISDPYEEPENPELVVHTHKESLDESALKILETLGLLGYVPAEMIQVASITRTAARVEGAAIPAAAVEAVSATMTAGGAPSAASVSNVSASD
jgi:hypothetical protein